MPNREPNRVYVMDSVDFVDSMDRIPLSTSTMSTQSTMSIVRYSIRNFPSRMIWWPSIQILNRLPTTSM
jgi:hypothetical protein